MDSIEILIICGLSVLLIILGLLAIFVPTDPFNDGVRLCAVGGAIIGLLLYPVIWGGNEP